MNHATLLKSQYRYNKIQVMYLTAMNEQEYNIFLLEMGKAWVNYYWKNLINTDSIQKTLLFRKWWTRWWNDVDDQQILPLLYTKPSMQRYSAYREMHQYVFDNENQRQLYMMLDFSNMKADFECEIKKLPKA